LAWESSFPRPWATFCTRQPPC